MTGPPPGGRHAARGTVPTAGAALADRRARLLPELVHVAHDEHEDDQTGQDVGHIAAQPAGELHAHALVHFGDEVVPAPAAAQAAEEQEEQAVP